MMTSRRAEPGRLATVGRRLMPVGRGPMARGRTDRYPRRRRTVANRGFPQPAGEAASPFGSASPLDQPPDVRGVAHRGTPLRSPRLRNALTYRGAPRGHGQPKIVPGGSRAHHTGPGRRLPRYETSPAGVADAFAGRAAGTTLFEREDVSRGIATVA